MEDVDAIADSRLWRLAAWFGVVESALLLMAWAMFLVSGDLFRDYTPFPASSLPLYQRIALFLYYGNIHTLVVPVALPFVTLALFQRWSQQQLPRWLPIVVGLSALAACVGPASALVACWISPVTDDRGDTHEFSLSLEELGPPAILGAGAVVLIVLPVLIGLFLLKAAVLVRKCHSSQP